MKQDLQSVIEDHQQFQKINLVRVLRQSVRLITHEISKSLLKKGHPKLSARHLNVFENLTTANNNIVHLANRAGISKQAMSKLVKEIADEGYIQVVTDQRDSRIQNVMINEKGASFLLFLQQEICNKYKEMLAEGIVTESNIESVLQISLSMQKYLEDETHSKSLKTLNNQRFSMGNL